MRLQLFTKLVILAGLTFGFGISLVMIYGVITERKGYRTRVVAAVAQSVAGDQTVRGPALVIRYVERVEGAPDAAGRPTSRMSREELVLQPESLEVRARASVTPRARGIYAAQVFQSHQDLSGSFAVPPRFGLDETHDVVAIESVSLVLGVSDARGIKGTPRLEWNGVAAGFEPGSGVAWLPQGISAPVPVPDMEQGATLPFRLTFELQGTERLAYVPFGARARVEVESDWPHPSFNGSALPDEREVAATGFSASWRMSEFATGVRRPEQAAGAADFGVRFIQPVDVYTQSERAVKYGLLFVVLTFVAFLLFEALKGLAIHPMQYGLAGAAVALFFLLLISLSEHLPFAVAYAVASAACVGLLAYYASFVLHSLARGAGFGLLLGALYGLLYVLLRAEDYALLLGSVLLFGLLAAIMILTRRLDWAKVGVPASTEKAG